MNLQAGLEHGLSIWKPKKTPLQSEAVREGRRWRRFALPASRCVGLTEAINGNEFLRSRLVCNA